MASRVWLITGKIYFRNAHMISLLVQISTILPRLLLSKRSNLTHAGTSSGFGRRLVTSALARGDRVIATARSDDKLQELVQKCDSKLRDNLRVLKLDITEGEAALKVKADEAAAIWGQIDVLVNNAGAIYDISSFLITRAHTQSTRSSRYRISRALRGRRVRYSPSESYTISSVGLTFSHRV